MVRLQHFSHSTDESGGKDLSINNGYTKEMQGDRKEP
jgi:hypothetical protein